LGVIGGLGYTPKVLRSQIRAIKDSLDDKNAPWGVDLLIPQIGGNARKTNVSRLAAEFSGAYKWSKYDYTRGQMGELVNVIIEEKAKLLV
jgi:hypothetical protein